MSHLYILNIIILYFKIVKLNIIIIGKVNYGLLKKSLIFYVPLLTFSSKLYITLTGITRSVLQMKVDLYLYNLKKNQQVNVVKKKKRLIGMADQEYYDKEYPLSLLDFCYAIHIYS